MKTILLVLGCAAVLLFQPTGVNPQTPPEPPKHGGKIETRYDGFKYETVMRLRKMKVNCDGWKENTLTDACVSIEVSLHCPGTQVNYVRDVTIQVVFENKDWLRSHPPDQRDLMIATDSETLRIGRMNLVSTSRPGTWNTNVEVLEVKTSYENFKKMALSQSVAIQVGNDALELREKNRAALRDLNNRIIVPATNARTTN